MIDISVRSMNYDADITLHDKITVIVGDSATGKSKFTECIMQDESNVQISTSDGYKLYTADTLREYRGTLQEPHKMIIVIDDADFIFSSEFATKLKNDNKNYYIIISRFNERKGITSGGNIHFTTDEVFEFIAEGKKHYIKRKFDTDNRSVYCHIQEKHNRKMEDVSGREYTGKELEEYIKNLKYNKRLHSYKDLIHYLDSKNITQVKPMLIFGMKGTGKTILLEQSIKYLLDHGIKSSNILLIQYNIKKDYSENELDTLIRRIENSSAQYIFVDEITQLKGFIDKVKYITDVIARVKEKVVLTGSDTVTFMYSEYTNLLNRIYKINTSVIKYADWCSIRKGVTKETELTIEQKKELITGYIKDSTISGHNDYSTNEMMYDYILDAIGNSLVNTMFYNDIIEQSLTKEIVTDVFFRICYDTLSDNFTPLLKYFGVKNGLSIEETMQIEDMVLKNIGVVTDCSNLDTDTYNLVLRVMKYLGIFVKNEETGIELRRHKQVSYITIPCIYYRLLLTVADVIDKMGSVKTDAGTEVLDIAFHTLIFTQTYVYKADDVTRFHNTVHEGEIDLFTGMSYGEVTAYDVKFTDKRDARHIKNFKFPEFKQRFEFLGGSEKKGIVYLGETYRKDGFEFLNAHDYLMNM